MRKVLILIVAVMFALSVASMGFAADVVKGTVSKVEGNKLTVKTKSGEQAVTVNESKGVKVGDKVIVKDGKVKRMTEGC